MRADQLQDAPLLLYSDKEKTNPSSLQEMIAMNRRQLISLALPLIAGPGDEDGGAAPAVPPATKIRAVFPGPKSTLYVDFDRAFRDAHPGGAWSEFLTAQAVANTVLSNFGEGFERVVLLVESQEAETIAGALTLAAPLKFRGDLVAAAPAASGRGSTNGAISLPNWERRNGRH